MNARNRQDVKVWVILALLVVVGSYLRLANLGALGFRWDEDLSSLAVRAILEKGVPELPSGMVYLRGGAFLYMMSLSAELFGFSEFALRLPAALFGIATIPLAFLFGRALFGARVGLIVAALIAISVWDIELSRYARMYAPFTFFYILTLYALWKYRVESESTAGGALCIASALLAVSFHQLGYTLVPALFLPLLIRGPSAWRRAALWVYPIVGGGGVTAFFFWWREVMNDYRRIPATESAAAEGAAAAQNAAAGAGGVAQAGADTSSAIGQLPLLADLLERGPLAAVALGVVLLVAAAVIGIRTRAPLLERVVLLGIAGCCALQLFNLALLGVFVLAFLKREGLGAFRKADVALAIGLLGISFLAWLALVVGLDLGPDTGIKRAVRTLLDFPHFFVFWGYPNEWPLVSIVAVVGGAWAFDRASRYAPALEGLGDPSQRASAASRFSILALCTPLVLNGLFSTSFELFRYNVPLNTLYFTFVALALVRWRELIFTRRPSDRELGLGRAAAAAGTCALVLLVIGFDLNPLRGWLVTQRDYVNGGPLYRAFGIVQFDDFKTPAAYVAEHGQTDDKVIVLDSREIFNYLGRADYWVRTDDYESQTYTRDGEVRDLYIAIPLLTSLDALLRVLDEDGTKWLIASDETLAASDAVDEEVRRFILEQDMRVVYVARDGDKKVYRFD